MPNNKSNNTSDSRGFDSMSQKERQEMAKKGNRVENSSKFMQGEAESAKKRDRSKPCSLDDSEECTDGDMEEN